MTAPSNVEVVQRCFDAISRRDAATLKRLSHADVEVWPLRALVEDVVYRGPDGVDQWMRDLDDIWTDLTIEIHEISEPERGHVVARVTLRGRGHESNAPAAMPLELQAWLSDGLVARAGVVTAGN